MLVYGNVVVGTLICSVLFHSMCDLKAAQMNMQYSQIWGFLFYEFELGHNTIETITNICWAKDEDTVDHSTATRWVKKFCLGCKNLDNQAKVR